MKKNLFFVFIWFSIVASSQTNLWSYYWGFAPTTKIQHTSKNIGYYSIYNDDGFVFVNHRLLKTTDGGKTFKEISVFEYEIKDFYFTDDNVGYLTDGYNNMYKTIDGAQTWHNISSKTSAYGIEKICFFSEDVGYTQDSSQNVFKTTNGGSTWSRLTSVSGDRMFFLKDKKTGWIGNSKTGKLYKTEDAGNSWSPVHTDSTLFKAYTDMFFLDSLHGWFLSGDHQLSGEYSKVHKTSDGGMTWNLVYNNSSAKFHHLVFRDNSVGVAVGNSGVYKTNDSGYSWSKSLSYDQTNNSALDIVDDTFFVSGIHGLHMSTVDPSQWNYSMRLGILNNSSSTGNDRLIADNGSLYVVNQALDLSMNRSEYYTSKIKSDGTWYESKRTGIPVTGSSHVVNQLNFQNENSSWYLHSLPFRSTDKGTSWTPLYSSSQPALDYRFNTIKFFGNDGIALSDDYIHGTHKILKTNNSGTTWEIVKQFEEYTFYNDSYFFNKDNGLVVNSKGEILKTYDGGVNWSLKYVQSSLSGAGGFRRLFFVNDNVGFAVQSGTIAKTQDGGENWVNMNSLKECSLIEDIFFINESKGWLSTGCGIYRTSDGGETWLNETINRSFKNIYMFDEKNGFATNGHTYHKYHPQPSNTSLTNPTNNQTNVPLNTIFQWQHVENAQSYYVSLGKTSSYDIFYRTITNNNYLQLLSLLEPNKTYYLNIIPYNSANQASNNFVYKFTTGNSLDISETNFGSTFQVSPNPTKDILYISNNAISNYKIYDLNGKMIQEGEILKNSINIKNISNGTYILQIGNKSKKIIKF